MVWFVERRRRQIVNRLEDLIEGDRGCHAPPAAVLDTVDRGSTLERETVKRGRVTD
ncbi:hypothetical protein [Agrobacterium albertimagni]|uniref:hypothetical protein n=1 Tax=Agrobacterium albertimagni TaxID=147266 RepID=UPI0012FD806D|nr:hypothetical protein [Agrobacterium albertimagni]